MGDDFPARSALASLSRVDAASPGVAFDERRPSRVLHVAGLREHEAASRLAGMVGFQRMPSPNRSIGTDACRILWVAPETWLLVEYEAADERSASGALPFKVVVNVSSAWTVIRASGPAVRQVLATTCALDLHPTHFPVGHCAQTKMAQVAVLLDRPEGESCFELYVARSYAVAVLEWFFETSGYCGFSVRPM